MRDCVREIIREIEALDFDSAEFLMRLEDECGRLEELEDALEAVEPLLRLLEDHAEADFGSPGPVVHFVERFYRRGYEALLLASVHRAPTSHTLWMVNRILNSLPAEAKGPYLDVLRAVAAREVPMAVKEEAAHFLGLHGG